VGLRYFLVQLNSTEPPSPGTTRQLFKKFTSAPRLLFSTRRHSCATPMCTETGVIPSVNVGIQTWGGGGGGVVDCPTVVALREELVERFVPGGGTGDVLSRLWHMKHCTDLICQPAAHQHPSVPSTWTVHVSCTGIAILGKSYFKRVFCV